MGTWVRAKETTSGASRNWLIRERAVAGRRLTAEAAVSFLESRDMLLDGVQI